MARNTSRRSYQNGQFSRAERSEYNECNDDYGGRNYSYNHPNEYGMNRTGTSYGGREFRRTGKTRGWSDDSSTGSSSTVNSNPQRGPRDDRRGNQNSRVPRNNDYHGRSDNYSHEGLLGRKPAGYQGDRRYDNRYDGYHDERRNYHQRGPREENEFKTRGDRENVETNSNRSTPPGFSDAANGHSDNRQHNQHRNMSSYEERQNYYRQAVVNDRYQNPGSQEPKSSKKSNCTGLAAIAGSLNKSNHTENDISSDIDNARRSSRQNEHVGRRKDVDESDPMIDPRTGVRSLDLNSCDHLTRSPGDIPSGMYGDCLLMTVGTAESSDGPISDRTAVDDDVDIQYAQQIHPPNSEETEIQMTRSGSSNSFGSSTEGSPTKLPGSPKPELLLGCGGSPSDAEDDQEADQEVNSTEDFFDFIAELNRNQAEATRHIPTSIVGDSSAFMRQCDQHCPDEGILRPPVLSINKAVQEGGASLAGPRVDPSYPKCCEPMSESEVNSFLNYDDDNESVASSSVASSEVTAQRVRPNRRSTPQESNIDLEYPKPASSQNHRRSGEPILATPDIPKADNNTPQDIAAKIASLKLTQNSDKRAANRRQQLQSSGPLNQDGRRPRGKKFTKAPPELTGLFFKSKADQLLDGDSTPPRHNDSEEEVESYGRDFKETYSLRHTRNMTYIDSHCHIDFLFKRHNMGKDRKWADYNNKYFQYSPESFEGFVAIYCEPYAFKDFMSYPHLLRESGVNCVAAFGIHPHSAQYYNEDIENRLRRALEHPKCTALGEIGLDYSDRASGASESIQKRVFIRQLELAKEFKKNLVLHCRDADQDFNQILRDHMPRDWVMHRHCFTENVRLLDELLRTFPNMYIGFTNLIAFSSAHEPREAARKMPLDRLLLETDAPYFLHPRVPKKLQYSHPSMAVYVAEKIAELKQCPLELVMKHARENTRTVYNI